jgi:hypothetical protein
VQDCLSIYVFAGSLVFTVAASGQLTLALQPYMNYFI